MTDLVSNMSSGITLRFAIVDNTTPTPDIELRIHNQNTTMKVMYEISHYNIQGN